MAQRKDAASGGLLAPPSPPPTICFGISISNAHTTATNLAPSGNYGLLRAIARVVSFLLS